MTKYICVEYGQAADTIIIFPEHITHKDVARGICNCNVHPVSAGFIHQKNDGTYMCHGRSETLNMDSRPELDAALANKMFRRN